MILEDFFSSPECDCSISPAPTQSTDGRALEACQAPQTRTGKHRPKWQKPDLLRWLDELTKVPGNYVQ